jgi:hypothetical protein
MLSLEKLVAVVLEQQVWELVQQLVQLVQVLVPLFVSLLEPEERPYLVAQVLMKLQLLLEHLACYF